MTFYPGQRVTWLQSHRGGYGYITPIKAEVIRATAKRVRIRLWRNSDGQPVEKTVSPSCLREAQS